MTKNTFRLTYINARRPLRVDGLDAVAINERPPGGAGKELIRGPTEAGRAIHGYYHEPPTTRHAANSFRLLHHSIVFRQISLRPHRSGAERFDCRRSSYCVSHGDSCSELARGWTKDTGDRTSAGSLQ